MSDYTYGGSGSYGREILVEFKSADSIEQLRSSVENQSTSPQPTPEVVKRLSERSKNLLLATIEEGLLDSQAVITIRNSARTEIYKITVGEFLNSISEEDSFYTENEDGSITPPPLRAAALHARKSQSQHPDDDNLDDDGYVILPSPRNTITSTTSSDYSVITVNDCGIFYRFWNGLKVKLTRAVERIQHFTSRITFLAQKNALLVAFAMLLSTLLIVAISVTIIVLKRHMFSNPTASTSIPVLTATLMSSSISTTSTSFPPPSSIPLPLSTSTTSTLLPSSLSTISTPLPASTLTPLSLSIPSTSTTLPASPSTPSTTHSAPTLTPVELVTFRCLIGISYNSDITLATEGQGSTRDSTTFPTSPSSSVTKLHNQHRKCPTDLNAWPKLWLDIVLLIDNSESQTPDGFSSMIASIIEIWQNIGGPIVSQERAKTRVGIITFDGQARIIATLDQIRSNADLIEVLNKITPTNSSTVNGENALRKATSLFGSNFTGDRPNVPNIIIIYTADWDGNNSCQIAQTIQQNNTVILAVALNSPNQPQINIPPCVYSPGEIYNGSDSNLDKTLLESLSYANCFCVGQQYHDFNHDTKGNETDQTAKPDVWYQFWLPRNDSKYYLRDKWAECILKPTSTQNTHDGALSACKKSRNHLPNEFSLDKHNFLSEIAKASNIPAQWIGLQYYPAFNQWFWNDFDRSTNQSSRTRMLSDDFAYWGSNQPNITHNKYCVKDSTAIDGQTGFGWTTAKCSGFQSEDHSLHSCQKPACDALNYCSDTNFMRV